MRFLTGSKENQNCVHSVKSQVFTCSHLDSLPQVNQTVNVDMWTFMVLRLFLIVEPRQGWCPFNDSGFPPINHLKTMVLLFSGSRSDLVVVARITRVTRVGTSHCILSFCSYSRPNCHTILLS